MQFSHRLSAPIASVLLLLGGGCEKSGPAPEEPEPGPTVLITQAQFNEEKAPDGRSKTVPGAARLVILRQTGQEWKREVLEDPESNVFHKAAFFTDSADGSAKPGIMTIGANKAPKPALLKLWRRSSEGWQGTTLAEAAFGGNWNRYRDVEIGDVTGDGQPDIAIVTHDQGVVSVLVRSADGWQATEIDRKPDTFVHEVELGDLNGDGVAEVYATPSQPNRLDGTSQPGQIVAYHHTPDGFERREVEAFPRRHAKEILVTDLGGDGRPSLLAVVEADLGKEPNPEPDSDKVVIRRYRLEAEGYVGENVCVLPDRMCRFLNAGDVDGDGKPEVVASMHKAGIWLARPGPGQWQTELINRNSGGFEHATVLADLDADGVQEIYVAADKQQQVCRYRWADGQWQQDVIYNIEDDKICFGIAAGQW